MKAANKKTDDRHGQQRVRMKAKGQQRRTTNGGGRGGGRGRRRHRPAENKRPRKRSTEKTRGKKNGKAKQKHTGPGRQGGPSPSTLRPITAAGQILAQQARPPRRAKDRHRYNTIHHKQNEHGMAHRTPSGGRPARLRQDKGMAHRTRSGGRPAHPGPEQPTQSKRQPNLNRRPRRLNAPETQTSRPLRRLRQHDLPRGFALPTHGPSFARLLNAAPLRGKIGHNCCEQYPTASSAKRGIPMLDQSLASPSFGQMTRGAGSKRISASTPGFWDRGALGLSCSSPLELVFSVRRLEEAHTGQNGNVIHLIGDTKRRPYPPTRHNTATQRLHTRQRDTNRLQQTPRPPRRAQARPSQEA